MYSMKCCRTLLSDLRCSRSPVSQQLAKFLHYLDSLEMPGQGLTSLLGRHPTDINIEKIQSDSLAHVLVKREQELHESWQARVCVRVLSTLMSWSNENKSCTRVDKREFVWEFHQLSCPDQTRTRVARELTSESLHESFINSHVLVKQVLHENFESVDAKLTPQAWLTAIHFDFAPINHNCSALGQYFTAFCNNASRDSLQHRENISETIMTVRKDRQSLNDSQERSVSF